MSAITICDRCGRACNEGALITDVHDVAARRDLLATKNDHQLAAPLRVTVTLQEQSDGWEARDLCLECWSKLLHFLLRTERGLVQE